MRKRAIIAFLFAAGFLLTQAFAGAADADAMAARILAAAGRPVGLAHLPRCAGDAGQAGALALALVKADANLRLHAQDGDATRIDAARRAADAQGWLGRRVWFDQADLRRLLPAGRSVDLVVLTDLSAKDLTPELAAEIRRVLHPWYGLAVVGDASGKLDAAALRQWAAGISPNLAPMAGEGSLLIVRAPALPGADDWPMWWHGADNNCASTDAAFSLPATMQWTGKPYFAPTRLELPIVSGGRLFMLWNGDAMDSSQGPLAVEAENGDGPLLAAQAVGSGVRLWARRLSPAAWVQVARSIVVADGDHLLVADGGVILELDAATGAERRRKPMDVPEIKWMTVSNGRLFALGGTVTQNHGQRSEKAVAPFRSSGLSLVALDRASLEPIWRVDRQAGKDAFDPRSPAIDGDRLFIAGEGDTVEAFSVKDGKPCWQVKAGFERARIVSYDWDRSSRHPVTGYASAGVYVVSGLEMKEAVVLSQAEGRRLWTRPQPGAGQFMPLAFWNLLWNGPASLDPLTGKSKGKMRVGAYLVARDGDGRDFAIDQEVDTRAVDEADATLYQNLRMVTAPTTYTVEGMTAGSACVVRLHLFEPWNDTPGRRLMDVWVNGTPALTNLDVFASAGGKNKALVRDVPARADGGGLLAITLAGTQGCPDPSPVLSGIEIRQEGRSLAVFPASGAYGPVKGFQPLDGDSCGRSTMAPFLESTAYSPPEPIKSACSSGSFVADGLLWKFPSPCTACTEWRGFVVQAAYEQPPQSGERLQRGGDAPPAAGTEAQGWLTHRGNAARSSSTTAAIPVTAALRWSAAPAHAATSLSMRGRTMADAEIVPAPPVIVGDRVIVAVADGSVEALNLADGKRVWRSFTSGRVHSSPAVWRDRVFVGSADGHLYAFALADGRELWRLRVAPDAVRIMVYGQMGSRWPVTAAPLAADGKVFACAGLMESVDGVHAVCADAVTGRIVWEQDNWAASESGGKVSGAGQFAMGETLFYHGGMAPPIRIAPADGACRPAFPETAGARLGAWDVRKWKSTKAFDDVWGRDKGQDIGALSGEWIVYGGRRLWTDQAEEGTWRSTIKLLARDRNGQGRLPALDVPDCLLLPSWDQDAAAFLYCSKRKQGIAYITRDNLARSLDALMEGTSTADILAMDDPPPKNGISVPPELLSKDFSVTGEGLAAWNTAFEHNVQPLACVLTRNAVLATTTAPSSIDPVKNAGGRLLALDRTNGSRMWEVTLPARAVHGGLAVAADGGIVLTLVDGQTVCVANPQP